MTSNATMEKFGYSSSLIKEYNHWVVLLRPKQVTLGALVLAAKSDEKLFSSLDAGAFTELHTVTRDIELILKNLFSFKQINYLMLMMVDPHIHFHVLPRYDTEKKFSGVAFSDPTWPGPPDLAYANEVDSETLTALQLALKSAWTNEG